MDYLRSLAPESLTQTVNNLFSTELAAIIVANGEMVPAELKEAADRTQTPLFTSPQQSPDLMSVLRHYLAQVLAESTVRHGVFMEVQGMGVMITGDSAVGKSELALELITRGHRLIADDVVEFYQVAPDTLEGRCPAMLQDFLEVRGLGVLNIRALFGETAVKLKKNLKLIVQLEKLTEKTMTQDRLQIHAYTQTILDVTIPEVRIPVAAGRNIAVLVEVAVRNHILQLRGINSTQQFIERHNRIMAEEPLAEP
jgi:HPr kinase/phosphorylase